MNIYTIYVILNQDNISPLAVRQGFSLSACILGPLWALYHKMWGIAFLYFILDFLINSSQITPNFILFSYCYNIAKLFLFGFFASELQEYYAKKRGYSLTDIILAKSEEEAEVRYFTRNNPA
jgi:hypothetical protein